MTTDDSSPISLHDVMAHDPDVHPPMAPGTASLRYDILFALETKLRGWRWRIESVNVLFTEYEFIIERDGQRAWFVVGVECPELVEPPAGTRVVVNDGRYVNRRAVVVARHPGFVMVKWERGGERGVAFDTTVPNDAYTVAEA